MRVCRRTGALRWRTRTASTCSPSTPYGNVEEQLLGVLCGSDVVRDREAEFAATAGSAKAIANEWSALSARIASTLDGLPRQISPRRGVTLAGARSRATTC
jgi:hypothetical protein